MYFLLVCFIFWFAPSRGYLEDNFLMVYDNDDPSAYKQVTFTGEVVIIHENQEHELPHLFAMKPEGKGLLVKCYAAPYLLYFDWSSGSLTDMKITMADLFAVSGITMHSKYHDEFFLTYFTSAEIIRRSLNLNDVSRKVLQDDAIPLSVDTYAYNGSIWYLAYSAGDATGLYRYDIESEKRFLIHNLMRSYDFLRFDPREQKVYLVFLDVIEVVDLKDSNVQPFVSLGSYIESFVVGEEYIYATLSMKEDIYKINKVDKQISTIVYTNGMIKRPRHLEIFESSRFK